MKKRTAYALLLPLGMLLLLFGLLGKSPAMSGGLVGAGTVVLGLSAALLVPKLARKESEEDSAKVDWQDERNTVIREKAAWYASMVILAAMSVSALALVLIGQMIGACVIAGLLLLYSLSILAFSSYFSKRM